MGDINFFNIKKSKEYTNFQKYLCVFIIIILINLSVSIYFSYKVKKVSIYKKELDSNFNNIGNRIELDKKLKVDEDFIFLENEIKKINGDKIINFDAKNEIELILEKLTEEVYIINLDMSMYEINISGKSKYKNNIYKFYKNLRLLRYSDDVNLSQLAEREDQYYFDINIIIR